MTDRDLRDDNADADPLLDAFLAEALGDESLPDLTDRIVQALGAGHAARAKQTAPTPKMSGQDSNAAAELPPPVAGVAAPIPIASSQTRPSLAAPASAGSAAGEFSGVHQPGKNGIHRSAPTHAPVRPRRKFAAPLAIAGSLFLAIAGYWIVASQREAQPRNDGQGPTAANRGAHPSQSPALQTPDAPTRATPKSAADQPPNNGASPPALADGEQPSDSGSPPPPAPNRPQPRELANTDPPIEPTIGCNSPGEGAQDRLASTRTDDEVLENVNLRIRQRWEDEGVKPAEFAGDSEWLRRVFVDILGRIPTMEESREFVQDRGRDKKNRLLNRLLASDRYVEELARNWTNIWSAMLIGRDDADRDGRVNREGFEQYLRRAFLTNKPYDKLVFELLTATGSNTPGEPDFNGAVSFLLDNLDENATPATAKIAQFFLGQRVQCTQCHNHPFNDIKQNQFWELNAFLRQARPKAKRRGGRVVAFSLTDVDFVGETGDADEAEIYYEQRNGILKSAYPVFLDGQRIDPSGSVSEVNRREELARFVVNSSYMSRALVNRIWSHFLGYGFTKPIDDMRPDNPVSHPELLDSLAGDFVNHGFDLRRLMRWIVLSEPYALSSQVNGERKKYDDPELGQQPLFSRFYMRQMRAEAVFESLLVATHAEKASAGGFSQRQQRKNRWLQQFAIAYGTDENDEATTFDGTISQTLMMWNGELVAEATSGKQGTFLHQVAANNTKNSVKIQHLYTAALGRGPTPAEIRLANEVWRRRQGDTLAALQDIWWALLNSSEFILNH